MNQATKLKIIVVRDSIERVNLTFPIKALKNIEYLMPDNVLKRLEDRSINLKQILATISKDSPQAQTLFELSEENKSYKVWIE